MISRPVRVPTERAGDLNMPLPTTCSTTDGSGPAFGARAASFISSGPFAPAGFVDAGFSDAGFLSTACA